MTRKLMVNIDNFIFKTILFLIFIKLIFSYLLVKLSYFQRTFTPNDEKFNILGLPSNLSAIIEYALLPLLIVFIVRNFNFFKKGKIIFQVSILLYLLNVITGVLNRVSLVDSINYSLKLFAPIYLFLALVIEYNRSSFDLKKNMINFIKVCFILLIIGLLFFDPSFNRGAFYFPIYFSGNHTHSYVLVCCFIGISYLLFRKGKKKWMIVFMLTSFTFLLIGYNIRTSLLLYLIYIVVMLYLCNNMFKYLIVKGAIIVLPIIILILFIKYSGDFDYFTSGRLSMYGEKIDQLSRNSFLDWLFGSGSGSDLIVIDAWWWEKKGAHSDIITYLVENGIVYLGLLLLVLFILFILLGKINMIYCSLILGYFITGLISNGILSRPLAAYMFFIVLSFIYVDIMEEPKKAIKT
ncbi:MAG: hypothetical protein QM478_01960 [Flavobacteriaceae bacterium]